ncbi:MAG: glycosyltransferase family 39 protein [Phycisphaerae bacterium]|nr:glycosyltransferase family 39 protein [Phycisphaerae bacterium]
MTSFHPEPMTERHHPRGWWVFIVLVVGIYAIGLCRDVTEPWIGLHDWNGAFFSQLARNLDRYPFGIHHGMPIVAVGSEVPPPTERSIYATHPPGLVWLVAGAFRVFGESEWAARVVPIVASAASLVLLVHLWRVAFGASPALIAAGFYAVMPMSVYFGRMVNHEAVCLCAMLAASACWVQSCRSGPSASGDRGRLAPARDATFLTLFGTFLVAGCWIDWSSCLFAAVFLSYVLHRSRRRPVRDGEGRGGIGRQAAMLTALPVATGCAAMMAYIVYAGLGGRWADLAAIFFSRATDDRGVAPRPALAQGGDVWQNTVENLSWPLLVLAAIGLVARLLSLIRERSKESAGNEASASVERRFAARGALAIIGVTGVIWLAVFPRQYALHQYWLFYLGPAIAMYAARAVLMLTRSRVGAPSRDLSSPTNLAAGSAEGRIARAGCMLFVMSLAWIAQFTYFDRGEQAIVQAVAGWRRIREVTGPDDRIILWRDPTWPERRGGYLFRNIVPPQFAFYADRAFTVEPDPERWAELAASGRYALFVLSVGEAARGGDSLLPLRKRYKEVRLSESLIAFVLEPSSRGGMAGARE